MNTKTTSSGKISVNRPYDSTEFANIISRMTPKDVFSVSIEVWTDSIELLRSGLTLENFDNSAQKARWMIFTGPSETLKNLGVA